MFDTNVVNKLSGIAEPVHQKESKTAIKLFVYLMSEKKVYWEPPDSLADAHQ